MSVSFDSNSCNAYCHVDDWKTGDLTRDRKLYQSLYIIFVAPNLRSFE
jgi:hypothetical protein